MTTNEIIRLTKFNSMPRVSYAAVCRDAVDEYMQLASDNEVAYALIRRDALRALATLIEKAEQQPVPKGFPQYQDEFAATVSCFEIVASIAAGFDPNAAIHPEGAAE
jgi:hypothetical protein